MIRILLTAATLSFGALASAETVTVYSYRQPDLIAPLLDAFTAESGLDVEAVYLKKGMIERVREEGSNSPADVFLTTDISRLVALENAGITQAVSNAASRKRVADISGVAQKARIRPSIIG